MGMNKQQLANHLTQFIDAIEDIAAYGPWINEARTYRQQLSHIGIDDGSDGYKAQLSALCMLTDSVVYDLNKAYERAREALKNRKRV